MIPVAPVPEPASFDEAARKPGNAWLAQHPWPRRPRDYWSRFRGILADGFANRCGYSAMHEPVGTVDPFRVKQRRRWYEQYQDGKLSLSGLSDNAPLIAAAVRKQLAEREQNNREGE